MHRRTIARLIALAIVAAVSLPVSASDSSHGADPHAGTAAHAGAHAPAPYAPYEFLIGNWEISPQGGGSPVAGAVFRWGPNHSYIWSAGSLVLNGKDEPHFEGILIWNGVHRNLDMLMSVDLQYGLAQEQGTFSIQPDGSVVREITAVYSEGVQPIGQSRTGPAGATAHFRQTFTPDTPDRIVTSVMRESEHGWVATFPGSDHLVMTRRANS